MNSTGPIVQVVIPAYNEEKRIGICLKALSRQTYSTPFSIVVVDNNSTDNTKKIAQSFPNVTVLSEKRKGYVFAVKTGVENTKSDLLAITDSDTQPSAHWVQSIMDTFNSDPKLIASGGPSYFYDGPFLLRYIYNAMSYLYPPMFNPRLSGMNMAFRRTAYEQIGGYDTRVNMGADTFLGIKLMKIGKVRFFRSQWVLGSSRRFANPKLFLREAWSQVANYFSLVLRHKPLYYEYDDIRT